MHVEAVTLKGGLHPYRVVCIVGIKNQNICLASVLLCATQRSVCETPRTNRPDMTFVVDWALITNYLSILVQSLYVVASTCGMTSMSSVTEMTLA